MRPNTPCIIGIGQSAYARWNTDCGNELQLACEAILAASRDADLPVDQIDGVTSFGDDANEAPLIQATLGMKALRMSGMVWAGGGGGSCGAVDLAAMAVESGRANYAVAFRSLAQGQTGRFGSYDPNWRHASFTHPFGMLAASQLLAPIVRRYMYDYNVTPEQIGSFAVACRAHAQRNPVAIMRDRPMDISDYLASRMIASPLRLFDCCLETNGACAVIVTTLERARDLNAKPVPLLASIHGGDEGWSSGPLGSYNMPLDRFTTMGAEGLAQSLYGRAGITPDDLDVAQIYDNFTGIAMMMMEDFGLCGRGEAGAFCESGAMSWPDGHLPVNTHGGNLSEAYIHGLNHVLEGVRQIRGTSTCQVADAELCLVTGGPGPSPTSALILGKL
nr:hypothetical protein [uncultured Hyphomonas sp.]